MQHMPRLIKKTKEMFSRVVELEQFFKLRWPSVRAEQKAAEIKVVAKQAYGSHCTVER